MNRLLGYAVGLVIGTLGAGSAWAGEANTDAWANSGWGSQSGSAGASATYDGDGGRALTRTDTRTGRINLARGLSVGFDRDGLDVSFSHAIAPNRGPGYAGTFNLSIGRDGEVSSSYGGVVALGGTQRAVQAGGTTSSRPWGSSSQALATGQANPRGTVLARTQSNHQKRDRQRRPVRLAKYRRPRWR